MFRELRKADNLLGKEETEEILKDGVYGVLATIGKNGYPYAVPLNYVYNNDAIYFHGATEGHKIDNLSFNNKVSFTVVGEQRVIPSSLTTHYKSVVVFGTAGEVDGEEKQDVLKMLVEKYAPAFRSSGAKAIANHCDKTKVFQIKIEHLTGKSGK